MCVFVFVLVFVQLFETFVVNKDRDRVDSTQLDSIALLHNAIQYSGTPAQCIVFTLVLALGFG